MSDTLASNENNNDHKSDKIESSGEDNSNILVQLSNKTLALLNPYKDESASDYEESEPKAKKSYWQSILSNLFGDTMNQSDGRDNLDSSKQKRPRRKRSKPLEHVSGPSEDQLSAPYIEEHRPEQPGVVRRPPETYVEQQQLIEGKCNL